MQLAKEVELVRIVKIVKVVTVVPGYRELTGAVLFDFSVVEVTNHVEVIKVKVVNGELFCVFAHSCSLNDEMLARCCPQVVYRYEIYLALRRILLLQHTRKHSHTTHYVHYKFLRRPISTAKSVPQSFLCHDINSPQLSSAIFKIYSSKGGGVTLEKLNCNRPIIGINGHIARCGPRLGSMDLLYIGRRAVRR